jgi:Protein of unknown function (DUF3305)
MAEDRFDVGVVVVRKKLKSLWADHAWLPHSVLPAVPAAKPWTSLGPDGEDELFYAGAFEVRLHPSETAHYRDNLTSGRPSLWVALRPIGGEEHEVATVTADPYEGEALAGGIGEIIEAVPMPSEIQAKVAAFFEAHHVERIFFKRKRDRADPEALGRRNPRRGGGEEEE